LELCESVANASGSLDEENQTAVTLIDTFALDIPLFAGTLPRGPGLYFNPVKVLALVAVYVAWVRVCWWVDSDCKEFGLPTEKWNPLVIFGGFVGLFLVWALPIFWAAFPVFLLLFLGPTLAYVRTRNAEVEEANKVLTPAHLRKVANRLFGTKPKASKDPKSRTIPIRLFGRSTEGRSDDTNTVTRAQESPYYRAAVEVIYEAIRSRATDIHLEPTKDEMTVRFRVDGIMQPQPAMDREQGDAMLNIFKVLAKLDITEKRKAQDGAFSAEAQVAEDSAPLKRDPEDEEDEEIGIEGEPKTVTQLIDFRIATAGSVSGEKMVMRLLNRSRAVGNLAALGMRERMRDIVRSVVTQPHGMFIVCGPTGSGKSTTLYACLGEIDCFQKNVITVENPVEYHIENVTQIEINPKAGKTFATELRSILRQDPDLIYIGEVRDQETAEIACQAAQTGHMVFTTLHANDTSTAILRLLDLGVQPFMVGSSLSAILGQRLVRKLCPRCKVGYRPNPELLRRANLPADKIKAFYRPPKEDDDSEPCEFCGGAGYRGRTGIFELFVINDKIRDLIKENTNIDAVRAEAVKNGMMYLQQDGMRVVIAGDTSIEELLRVAK